METRMTLMQLIPLAMKRIHHGGRTMTLETVLEYVTDRDSLEECSDEELFAVLRTLHGYDAFNDVRVVPARDDKVVQMELVSTQRILDLDSDELRWLLFAFAYCCERKGLQRAMESGLLATWLRMLRLWEASQFPGVDNLSASQVRQAR
ncbi:MAG: hypothetical protein J0L85_02470 [Zoogloea sp.]|nr:hypothetical protein [Zoogloea sp.]MCA0186023.1 hypothetical protein [Pseudomonadota bacterium]